MVQEEIPCNKSKTIFDYVVDMELGMCSCTRGSTGAACRHQAAVAKHFKLASVSIPPVHSKESRHIYAVIARGNYTRGVEFYADLVDTTSGNHEGAKHNHDAYIDPPPPDDEPDVTVSDEPEVSTDSTDLWSEAIQSFGDSLREIVDDLVERLKQGDHNLLSGVTKFIKSYRKMANSSGDSAISYALHNFGQSDSESLLLFYS